jgi:putative pyruvate formate lyase activating enzyme
LRCRFCQNAVISHGGFGQKITVQRLAEIFRELEADGAHNINLVNPTHFAHVIREALLHYKPKIPVIYNSSGFERVETLQSLEGLIDVYLPDCKYISETLAASLSDAPNYFSFAKDAILEMSRQTGAVKLSEDGLIQRGTIVRHLVLPGHTKESMAVLDWLNEHKSKVWVSLMFQYTPMGEIDEHKELQRSLTRRECNKVMDYMTSLGIVDGYAQSRQSSGEEMIPAFDLTGV